MDDLDRRIIATLQIDGATTNVAIARDTGVSEETVRRRTGRLIRDGTIKIAGVPNASKMGINSQALIGLQVDADKLDAVAETLAEMNEITWVAITTGSIDVMAWVNLRSSDELRYLLSRQIGSIEGVRTTETFVCMENLKQQYGVTVWQET
jgi:Lrp/AsnC family transcriptional regulator for asnA, asnC and gidA